MQRARDLDQSKSEIRQSYITKILALIFWMHPFFSSAQSCSSRSLDSMIKQLDQPSLNTGQRIDLLNAVASGLHFIDPHKGLDYAHKAYERSRSFTSDRRLTMSFLQKGINYARIGQSEEAKLQLKEAEKMLIGRQNPEGLTLHKIYSGYLEQILEHYSAAENYYKEGIEHGYRFGLTQTTGIAHYFYGTLKTERNDSSAALYHYQKALRFFEGNSGHYTEYISCLLAIAENYELSDNYIKAKEFYKKANSIANKKEEYGMLGWIKLKEGKHFFKQYKSNEALTHLSYALERALECKLLKLESSVYNLQSQCYDHLGDYPKTIQILRRLIEVENGRDHDRIAQSYQFLSQTYGRMGKYNQALNAGDTALWYRTRYYHPRGLANVHGILGYLYFRMGKLNLAKQNLNKILALIEKHGEDNTDADRMYIYVGGIYNSMGLTDSAILFINKSIQLHEKLRDFVGLRYAYNMMSQVQKNKGDSKMELFYLNKYCALVRVQQNKEGLKHSYFLLSNFFRTQGELKNAVNYLDSAEAMAESLNDDLSKAWVFRSKAEILNSLGNANMAIDLLLKAIIINEKYKDKTISENYETLATIYSGISNYPKALEKNERAISGFKESGDMPKVANCFIQKASILCSMKHYEEAKNAANNGLEIYKTIYRPVEMSECYAMQAYIEIQKTDYVLANKYLDTALGLLSKYPGTSIFTKLMLYKAEIALNTHKPGLGLNFLKAAVSEGNIAGTVNHLIKIHKLKSELYEQIGYYDSAYYAYIDYITLRDSVVNIDTRNEILAKELQFEFDKKEAAFKIGEELAREHLKTKEQQLELSKKEILIHQNELALRNKDLDLQKLENLRAKAELNHQRISSEKQAIENEIKEARISLLAQKESLQSKTLETKSRQQVALIAGMILLGLVSFSAIRNYLNQRRYNKLMEAKNTELSQTLKDLRNAQKKLVETENEKNLAIEKTRIARDMHDDIGSGLTKIAFMTSILKENPEKNQGQIDEISNIANELVDNMSQIIWVMNPENNKLENLLGYFRKYSLDFFDNSGIQCEVEIPDNDGNIPVSQPVKRNLFLIFKEVLHNVLKHANATKVFIKASNFEHLLTITIRDNGVGFDPEKAAKSGNGINNMYRRMGEIGGKISINTHPERGTTIELACHFTPRNLTNPDTETQTIEILK